VDNSTAAPRAEAAPSRPEWPQGPAQPVRTAAPEPAPARREARPPDLQGPTPPAGGLDINAVRRSWPDILEAVKQRSKVAWIMLDGTHAASIDHNVLTVAFAEDGKRKGFSVGGKETVFREVLKQFLGVDWRIETVLGNGRGAAPAPSPAAAPYSPPARPGAAPAPRRERAPEPPPPPPPPDPPPMDESDEVDPLGDADAGADAEVNGMALIQRELGGQIIREIDNT
jgi:DNA polymerase-3 subunit gamma/tau